MHKEQFHIVDGGDCKVGLEENHVRLLKDEGIIYEIKNINKSKVMKILFYD